MKRVLVVAVVLLAWGCREEEPEPDPDQPDPVAPELIDAACAIIASCAPAGSDTVSQCATGLLARPAADFRFTGELSDCLERAAGSCPAVEACLPSAASLGNPCADTSESSLCVDGVVVGCFAGEVDYATDCGGWGLGCADPYDEWTCQGDGQTCNPSADEVCEGNVAVMCLGARAARFSCDELIQGSVCQARDGRVRCLAPEPECDAASDPGACDGDLLTFCSATGRVVSLDCTTLGFAACVQQGDRSVCGDPT